MEPIDKVVGRTEVPLYRSISDEEMPAVIEGSSHDFLADAFRAVAKTEVGVIRGFRYGTHVAVGPITRADLYHYMPIGPLIARGTMTGHQLEKAVEDSAYASLATDVAQGWTGGWVAGMSGATLDLNPFGGYRNYTSNFRIGGVPLDDKKRYSVAGYHYREDPRSINRTSAHDVEVLKDKQGNPMDAVEVVVAYLDSLPNQTVTPANLPLNRFRLVRKLPAASYGNKEMQPLYGVPAGRVPAA
jgi:2',3'-cyclic-nucleotide 2'-phosphodiesterase (5'-nucleotidase family)